MWNFFEQEKLLDVAAQSIVGIPNEEFAMIRKQGLGASDASVYLGLMNQWKTTADLIEEKCRMFLTDEERAIGEKETVRKGVDLEPMILSKAEKMLETEVIKPTQMFRVTDFPYLTISFDGVALEDGHVIPVEAKFVSIYGTKYYNREANAVDWANWDVSYSTEKKASLIGIPPYYYAQIQQQMLGLGASYGYLAAQFDKDWMFKMYRVPRDEVIISKIITEGYSVWNKILAKRGNA